jgi:threonine dehydratase
MTEVPTPLEQAPASLAGDRNVLLKREDVHELGAFKWRGALPVLERYREDGEPAFVPPSSGIQGDATAGAPQLLGLRAVDYATQHASLA